VRTLFGFAALAALGLAATPPARITYLKSFPGSTPPYVEITVGRDGHGQYKEAPDDPLPVAFQLSPAETGEIFGLADKLDHFSRPLESNLKVAFMGDKTLRWESGAEKHETKFNYSLDPSAQQIADWFDRIGESEVRFVALQRAAKYDRLGVNQELLLLEIAYDNKRLAGKAQFLPLLDRIAKGQNYMHMARERAAKLADAFRAEAQPQ
jgi:hypothetical protein